MKKIVQALIVILTTFFSAGQGTALAQSAITAPAACKTGVESLPACLESYLQALLANKHKKILSFLYPALFQVIPQQQWLESWKQAEERGGVPKVTSVRFTHMGKPQTFSKGQFIIVHGQMVLELARPGDATPQIDNIIEGIIKKMISPNVKIKINEKRSVFIVTQPLLTAAIDENASGWRLLDFERLPVLVQKKLLPEGLAIALVKAGAQSIAP